MIIDPLTLSAIIPALILLWYIYHLDPVEKEPAGLLLTLLVMGGLSTLFAGLLEYIGMGTIGGSSLTIAEGVTLSPEVVQNFLIVALVEEGCKYFLLVWCTWSNRNFDYVFDGIVYAVFVGLGFAIAENITYVWSYGMGTAFVRAFTAIPGHCVFAVFMGYFYGLARRSATLGHGVRALLFGLCALIVPLLCHGLYDYLASYTDDLFMLYLVIFVAVGMLAAKHASKRAQRIGQ
ncbi:MAG: PrsW family intramembrane metalloprotease [Eggerthellaceae bacterium]|jgi:RsiW-degrading membrane proteinase PrsW (M82 family)